MGIRPLPESVEIAILEHDGKESVFQLDRKGAVRFESLEGALVITRGASAVREALGGHIQLLDLSALASLLGEKLAPSKQATALEEAALTRSLWLDMWERLSSVPAVALMHMVELLSSAADRVDSVGFLDEFAHTQSQQDAAHQNLLEQCMVLAEVVRRAEIVSRSRPDADTRSLREIISDRARSSEPGGRTRQRARRAPCTIDESEVEALFGPTGPLAKAVDGYEDRPQQRRLARAFARTLAEGGYLLAEGGTGVGKSLAYLVPAALLAGRTGRPVVISTYTKNLQSQLFRKDLPVVFRALGTELYAAVAIGRQNYLCLRKFFRLLRTARHELRPFERGFLAAVVAWAVRTNTGELEENAVLGFAEAGPLRELLASETDECLDRACPNYSACFVRASRVSIARADLIVANHALVFAELGLENPILPEYQEIVFDEAHHIEEVATEHLAVRISRKDVMKVLSKLFRTRPHQGRSAADAQSGTGLLADVFAALDRSESESQGSPSVREAASHAALQVKCVADAAEGFFSSSSELLDRASEKKRRYTASDWKNSSWKRINNLGRKLDSEMRELERRLNDLSDAMARNVCVPRELASEVNAGARAMEKLSERLGFVLSAEAEGYVYWVEDDSTARRAGAAFCAAPVELGPILREHFLARKRSVIFTSATLRAGGSFEHIAGRLGLELRRSRRRRAAEDVPMAATIAVDSPFDYERASLVVVPTYLGDPRDDPKGYVERLARLVIDVSVASHGRTLVLFTSYSMLEETYALAAESLASQGLRVLAQARDGPRELLLDELRSGRAGVIFGAASFWEGIDVPGEALSSIVVARLPFQVPTDPVIQARAEVLRSSGRDPFAEYYLPEAVLKLRQGFGRLIRTKADRGVAIIADSRVLKASYGRAFLEALPVRPHVVRSEADLKHRVEAFFRPPKGAPERKD